MIYFIRCAGRIKIGYSNNPKRRFDMIKTSLPFDGELVGVAFGGADRERELHAKFSDTRVCGEWFEATDALAELIEAESIRSVPVSEGDFAGWQGETSTLVEKHPIAVWRRENRMTLEDAATVLSVDRTTVIRWEKGKSLLPHQRMLEIERITGISRRLLRPDLFRYAA